MKQTFFLLLFAAALYSCKNSTTTDHISTEAVKNIDTSAIKGTAYLVDSNSTIAWMGSKPTGNHSGTLKVSEGKIMVDGNNITGGNFIINMNTLADTDMAGDAENQKKLEGHLKSPDFFNVEKFPTAKFVIQEVKPYQPDSVSSTSFKNATHTISGNLTLKDSTKFISFPAKVTMDNNSLVAVADLNIDRTLWGLNYKGPGNPQDWFISKTVNIKINISATKH